MVFHDIILKTIFHELMPL